jgi:phosphohistidine phosphatase
VKRLAILRHAKSSWDDAQLADGDRPLNERGWKAARRMGRELKQRAASFDMVLASPAARVTETIEGVQEELKLEAAICFERDIYLASHETLLEMVRGLPESVHAPLLVGHNPGLQQLIVALTRDDPKGLRAKVEQKLPTAAFVRIDLPVEQWSNVEPATGTIAELIVPKELD